MRITKLLLCNVYLGLHCYMCPSIFKVVGCNLRIIWLSFPGSRMTLQTSPWCHVACKLEVIREDMKNGQRYIVPMVDLRALVWVAMIEGAGRQLKSRTLTMKSQWQIVKIRTETKTHDLYIFFIFLGVANIFSFPTLFLFFSVPYSRFVQRLKLL